MAIDTLSVRDRRAAQRLSNVCRKCDLAWRTVVVNEDHFIVTIHPKPGKLRRRITSEPEYSCFGATKAKAYDNALQLLRRERLRMRGSRRYYLKQPAQES